MADRALPLFSLGRVHQQHKLPCWQLHAMLVNKCGLKQSCELWVDNSVFGDPCYGTYKYLWFEYQCYYSFVLCEGTLGTLSCTDEGKKSSWCKRPMADKTIIFATHQKTACSTSIATLRIPIRLWWGSAKTSPAVSCLHTTQCLVIHVRKHLNIWGSYTTAFIKVSGKTAHLVI